MVRYTHKPPGKQYRTFNGLKYKSSDSVGKKSDVKKLVNSHLEWAREDHPDRKYSHRIIKEKEGNQIRYTLYVARVYKNKRK